MSSGANAATVAADARAERRRLAVELATTGRLHESIPLWHAEVSTGPDGVHWMDDVIASLMDASNLTLAGELAGVLAALRWGSSWHPPSGFWPDEPLPPQTPEVFLSAGKLRHDIEQFRHLRRLAVLGDEFNPVIAAYEQALARLAPTDAGGRVPLDSATSDEIGHVYNRIVHVRQSPRLGRALSDRWSPAAVEDAFVHRPPGLVVIDDFLSEEALEEVRRYCLESTVWLSNRYPHGRLGAFFRDGFTSPLLLQIAEELRRALPRVIGDRYPLRQMWGFKNSHTVPPDASLHADFAAVNVNFWITPTEANLDEGSGGLIVYEADAPPEWDFYTYNGNAELIRAYLARCQARQVTIPYRANRAVIFNSDLFHETQAVRFRDGYEDRRVNITMLYGHREQDVHHRRLGVRDQLPSRSAWQSSSFARARRR